MWMLFVFVLSNKFCFLLLVSFYQQFLTTCYWDYYVSNKFLNFLVVVFFCLLHFNWHNIIRFDRVALSLSLSIFPAFKYDVKVRKGRKMIRFIFCPKYLTPSRKQANYGCCCLVDRAWLLLENAFFSKRRDCSLSILNFVEIYYNEKQSEKYI